MRKYFNKELVMTQKENEDLRNSTKYLICDVYVDGDVKVRDHRDHVFGEYRGSAHRDKLRSN